MSKSIHFFATREDLLGLLTEVESVRMVHYVEAGMFEIPESIIYGSASQIPELGLIHVDSTVLGRILLIADATVSFMSRSVPQRRGGTRYAMDQKNNPDTVSLHPGGQFNELTLLAGDFGTCTNSPVSAHLLKIIERAVHKRWIKIKSYFVGPEALAVLDAGGRLTTGLRSPPEYDLRR